MTLYENLQQPGLTEEDVKGYHIAALGLKPGMFKRGWIDIQTENVWFEAKKGHDISTYQMFTQLFWYVDNAKKKGQPIPPFLCVVDQYKAGLMETGKAIPIIEANQKLFNKCKNASGQINNKPLVDAVSSGIGVHVISYLLKTQELEYITTVKSAINSGQIIRTQITPNNLKLVFDQWVEQIGKNIGNANSDDYCLFFYADIMTDGNISTHKDLPAKLIHIDGKPTFMLNNKIYNMNNIDGYRSFWQNYDRPPKEEYRNYLLERRDSLIPYDSRSFQGEYYTPLHIVKKAYEFLNQTLGDNWQKEYIVWDMCCGVGNLETMHGNIRNCFMSTLEQRDIAIMTSTRTCVSAFKFQYDYLNDDICDDGTIDYTITNKMPKELIKIIGEAREGKKKMIVLINPPYAEATNANNLKSNCPKNKTGVAKTKAASYLMNGYGKSSNELFTQFIARIAKEIPNAALAVFSTLKYINAPNFEDFRKQWNAEYLNGFIVHSKAFDGLKGDFPIGFLIWKTHNDDNAVKTPIAKIDCEVINKEGISVGSKSFYNISINNYLNKWIKRPPANKEIVVPLKNAITPSPKNNPRGIYWSNNAIGYSYCCNNDLQHTQWQTNLVSSVWGSSNGIYITKENFRDFAVLFTMRRIVPHTWQNDRDQFLKPNRTLDDEFYNDCLIWMLFNGENLTAGTDNIEWNGKKWSLVNHFIPYSEDEVGSHERFESDFIYQYIQNHSFSDEARHVLLEGKKIWASYFKLDFNYEIRETYKLDRCDVGWYQIRKSIEEYNVSALNRISFDEFKSAYSNLTSKLYPKVYEYGFLM